MSQADLKKALVKRAVVIGVGLIGGSLAKALREAGAVETIVGVGLNDHSLKRAVQLGVVDEYSLNAAEAIVDADLIIVATPVLTTEKVLAAIKDAIPEHAVITDVGSAKGIVVDACRHVFGRVPPRFVLGHPIAGSEKSGVDAAKIDLYCNHSVILTPQPDTEPGALELVRRMWQVVGANVLEMGVAHHDHVLASTSHLPHLLAYSLVDTLAKQNESQEIFRYAAGGFADFTRIASSDPTMWHDIFLANKQAVLESLDKFSADIDRLRHALEQSDSKTMLGVFTRAKAARDHFTKMLAQRAYVEPMNQNELTFLAGKGGPVQGRIRVPGDKSISHRSIMLGAIAEGETHIEGFLEGEDSLATLQAFRDMGVVIEGPHHGRVTVYGVGLNGLTQPPGPLYVGNSGTSIRLLAGLLSGQAFDTELRGDASLTARPMGRVANPLAEMGAVIETSEGKPPMVIRGGHTLKGVKYALPVASAQVKSCMLLAGLYAEGETCVVEPAPTRDHTERMLRGFGYDVSTRQLDKVSREICVKGGGVLKGSKIDVPADISSAAFFMVAASIVPGSDLVLEHVGINPTRVGIVNILTQMGADIELTNDRVVGGEPVADIRVRYAPLKGINIPEEQVPLAIDEFPALFVAAACAEGRTVLTGAEELRVKESDRIQAMADGLQTLGVKAEATPDGMIIDGGPMGSGTIDSLGDHRIAMSFAVAALRAQGEIKIQNCANVATSFPNFVELASQVGMSVQVQGA
ncbi:MAG: bifunctional prephenate dehydrogenase/3-phosphoshikimate 1-carboxyvinyltransferase [Pseudomonadales bacterium]